MPDPAALLELARELSITPDHHPPSDARLRRAVSTAYYAVFHHVLRTAATRFMGPNQEDAPGYATLYRSFEHRHMRDVCEKLRVATVNDNLKRVLRRDMLSQPARDFANAFPRLQEARHLADYDPKVSFEPLDAVALVDLAALAMSTFDKIDTRERTDIMTLMMVRMRTP